MNIGFRKLVLFVLKFWWILIASALAGGLLGFVWASLQPDSYRASAQIRLEYNEIQQGSEGFNDLREILIANTIATIRNRDFLEVQFDNAGAQQLYGKETGKSAEDYVSVARQGTSDFIQITCSTSKASWSVGILENILKELPGEMSDVTVKTVSEARIAEELMNPKLSSAILTAGVFFVLAVIVLAVIRIADGRIYDAEEVSERYRANFLGDVSEGKK